MGTRVPLDPEEVRRREMSEKLSLSLAEIGLSVRTTNCLDDQGISTVADLLKCRRQTLLNIPNFGAKTLDEVFKALERLGFVRAEVRKSDNGYAPDEAAARQKEREERQS